MISSNLNVAEAAERGQILSYSRGLRKLMSCAYHFSNLPIFDGRLKVIRYEDLVSEPEKICRDMCDFLGIQFKSEMLNTDNFVEPSDSTKYNGGEAEEVTNGISPHRATRWRNHLQENDQILIEFLCGPEMKLFDYEADFNVASTERLGQVISRLESDVTNRQVNWRTDTGVPSFEIGAELRRWYLTKAILGITAFLKKACLFDTVKSAIINSKF